MILLARCLLAWWPDMAEPKVVNVEVHGQKYPIKTELDARYVEELAEFVEARMALARQAHPRATPSAWRS